MKILAIRIKNLASLEGTTEIDFTQEPLCSAGIFAITGPTGSGKSTILDALCLALYAKTPRYVQARETGVEVTDVQGSTISQGDVRAILRDGTAEGFAEVDFVGVDEQHYRAAWSVRRAYGRDSGNLQDANTTLKNLNTGSDIGGRKTELLPEITRLVGLTYDQFTRSVLLAQGDFTAFLKADKDQKASLLEKLTGTHIYSALSKKVFERHRDESQQLKVLQQSSEGIHTLTTEELEMLKQQEEALAAALQTLDAKITATTKEIEWHEAWQTHRDRVAQAQEALETAQTEQDQAADRAQRLKQVEQVQPTRTWVDAHDEAAEQLSQRQRELEDADSRQQLLDQQVQEIQTRLSEAVQQLEAETTQQEEAKPLLDEAKKLDVQLHAKAEEVAAAHQALEARKTKQISAQQRLSQAEQEAEILSQQIIALQSWKDKHEDRKPVAENRTFIVTKLAEARKQLDAITKAEHEAARCIAGISTKEQEHDQLAKQAAQLDQTIREANARLGTLRDQLAAISAEQLREDSKALTTELDTLLMATAQWRQVYQAQLESRSLTEKSASAKQALAEKEAQLAAAHAALQAVTEQRKTSKAILEKAMLAASENVEALRGQLVDGQPCPVCGSDSHPYAYENPQLNHVLHELKQAHEALETNYNGHLATHSQLSQAVPLLQHNIAEVEAQAKRNQLSLDNHLNTWEGYAVSRSCTDVAPEQKEQWLADRAAQIREKQAAVAEQLTRYEQFHTQAEAIRQQVESQQNEHTRTADTMKDLERSIQTLKDRLADAQSAQSAHTADLEECLTALRPNFLDQQWVANWKSQPAEFIASINAFADEWQNTVTELHQATQQHQVSQATLAGIRAEQQSLESDSSQAEQELSNKQSAYASLQQARESIFNGEPTALVESRLKQRLQEAQERLTASQQQQSELKNQQANITATISQTKVEVARLEKRKGELSERVMQWLSQYNAKQETKLDYDTLKTLLGYPSEWIVEERTAVAAIDRAVTQSASVLDERKRQLDQHEQLRPTDQSLETLREVVGVLQTNRFESQRDHNEIGYKLKQDEANKRQLGDLLGAIQNQAVVVDNWSKLNDIIGSADGKKFRQVAQEYTLDVLLTYANVHLEVLAQRYRLQRIPNTLGLQVLDQDMGDEVRTVYSLSGGESFLVSLALALGLASLSANRMQVESLFIDEGFGSLDPNTLNIAMDALERLHNQGRKVGVISHVQEMTERIPVQITVSKQQSGRSKVEVVGYKLH